MKFLLVTAGAIVALAPATAQAASPTEAGILQTLYNPDGSGRLFADGNGSETVWERCDASLSVCEAAGTTRELTTGDAAPGTIFRLAGAATGPTWHGNLAIVTPPRVQGVIAADELVTPVPATWQGGWDGSFDQTQLAACKTPAGEGCTSISFHKYIGSCPGFGAVIDPSFAGRYLRVADQRRGPGTIETLEAYATPYGSPILPPEGDTAVAMVGRIGPATHQATVHCGPPPLVEAWISSRGVAKVSCALGCHAVLFARHAGHVARAVLRVPATGLPTPAEPSSKPDPSGSTLAIPAGALRRLGGGRTNFAVEVGGQTYARKRLTLPSHRRDPPGGHRGDRP